jgi:hypothetical protein
VFPFYSCGQPGFGCTLQPKHVAVLCGKETVTFRLKALGSTSDCTENAAGMNCLKIGC